MELARGILNANSSAGLSPQEEVEAVEPEAPVVEEEPAQGVAAAEETVLAWVPGAALLWTSPQLFDLQLRH